jgi:peptidoglycan/LPS O-acetylase OafA/YrhL
MMPLRAMSASAPGRLEVPRGALDRQFVLGYVPALDGLRAVAILMVVAYHDHRLRGGFLGVDVFFALSGFLITSVLLEEWRRRRTMHLGKFYARRFLRLAPALLVFVLAVFGVDRWLSPGIFGAIAPRWGVAAALYVTNLLIAYGREYPLGPFSICWSLAQEEQFYLLWPLLLRTLLRLGVTPLRLAGLLLLPISVSTVVRLSLRAADAGDPGLWLRLYFGPDTRADAILVGCVLALVVDGRGLPDAGRAARWAGASALLGILALGALAATCDILDPVRVPLLFTLSAAASTALVLGALAVPWLRLPLAWPGLVWIGRLSYSLYLWHEIGLYIGGEAGPAGRYALPLALAAASHYVVERPFLRLKRRLSPGPA